MSDWAVVYDEYSNMVDEGVVIRKGSDFVEIDSDRLNEITMYEADEAFRWDLYPDSE